MVSRILSRFNREHVISLEMPKWKRASSRLEGRISWFFSSCGRFLSSYDGDLRHPLIWPQERPVFMQIARSLSGFLSRRSWVLSPHLELRTDPKISSPVLTWILGLLWSLHRGVRPRLEWGHARLLSCLAVAAVSDFPLS